CGDGAVLGTAPPDEAAALEGVDAAAPVPSAGEGGGPYFDCGGSCTGCSGLCEGDAVAANGFTGADASYPGLTMEMLPAGSATALGGSPAGAATGAPQVAQNLPDPMSSAPHFAQFAMDLSMLGQLAGRYKGGVHGLVRRRPRQG